MEKLSYTTDNVGLCVQTKELWVIYRTKGSTVGVGLLEEEWHTPWGVNYTASQINGKNVLVIAPKEMSVWRS